MSCCSFTISNAGAEGNRAVLLDPLVVAQLIL
jgi:hypothetical protein